MFWRAYQDDRAKKRSRWRSLAVSMYILKGKLKENFNYKRYVMHKRKDIL